MKKFFLFSITSVLLLGAVACHRGGGGSSQINPNPGGVFGDDNPITEVTVCHLTEGLADGAYTLIIASSDLSTHMAHGDTEGECLTDGPPNDDDPVGSGDDDDDDDDDDAGLSR